MITQRHPVLIWADGAGGFGAALATTDGVAAHGPTEADAVRQLRDLLEWQAENEPWFDGPELVEARLLEVRVDIRPGYRSAKRVVPCPETVTFTVPCVHGRQESGQAACVIPHFDIQFQFEDVADLRGLVAHYVREALQSVSPAELAGRIPPPGCRLGEVVIRNPGGRLRRPAPEDRPELKPLFAVADPLFRGRSKGSAAYGRDELVGRLSALLESEKSCLLLVGEAGVGKSTVLQDAVRRLSRRTRSASTGADGADSELDSELARYRYWRGTGARMIAGMRYLGEWEERCESFIQQLANVEGVFCVENLLELTTVGGSGTSDSVAAFLMPYLQRGEIRVVAEATPFELEACRRMLPGFADLFQVVNVPAFVASEAERVLRRLAEAHAGTANRRIAPGFVERVLQLFRRFQPYAAFPGPAAAFVRKLCESRDAPRKESKELGAGEVVEAFARETGIPELFLRDDMPLDPASAHEWFGERVIGQPSAVQTAVRLVTTIKAGLNDPDRPLGVLLFCGPTGVGKTALARCLVEYCFGGQAREDRLVRLDMSEYAGWGSGRRFLTDPQGRPSPWIERVRRQPFCVVLFDEIEKAAPEVFDVLLGLLDEGRLADPLGRVTWFRSAIVVMTSNLGADTSNPLGFAGGSGPDYAAAVGRFFRPEFFNRLDEVVTFAALSPENIEGITRKELAELGAREGLAATGLRLEWTDRLVRELARSGYDHRLGARPLQRTIEKRVAIPLARWRVANPRRKTGRLRVDCDDAGTVFIEHREGAE